ncbi:hypothetical protein [Pengzhenrongella sp.]|uniref:hypothetical protein n=1 Tax=Pengzhenrongella sp. TaxID=2888820 RepID=UPI002F954F2B
MNPSPNGSRRARILAGATAGLALANLAVYILVIRSQGGPDGSAGSGIAWWYVAVLLVTVAASVGAAATGRVRRVMPASAVLLGVCALLGLLSIGILLLPAVLTAVLSGTLPARGSTSAQLPGA